MSVDILMSTYNGANYIHEQIDSILEQTYDDWNLIIRDDCSTDKTVQIIKDYSAKYPQKIRLIQGESVNIGIIQSFAKLLEYSSSPYIMFCDQDDVWLPEKILVTLDKMRQMEKSCSDSIPLLVHTDLKVIDCHGKLIHESFRKYQNLNSPKSELLNRLLVQNVITGNSVMINQALARLAVPIPQEAIMHDWWMGLIAVAFGKVGYVNIPTILYRQHEKNKVGAKKWGTKYIMRKLINLNSIREYFDATRMQAKIFLTCYGSTLNNEKLNLIKTYSDLNQGNFFAKRLKLLQYGFYEIGSLKNLGLFLVI
jgi:glycosyltransferase involved in cell wall biosynthesis